MAIIASARQTNEELYLLKKLASKLGAITDSVPRHGEADELLVCADRNPNSNGARLLGICFTEMGINLPEDRRRHPTRGHQDVDRVRRRRDPPQHGRAVQRRHRRAGSQRGVAGETGILIVSDILPNETTRLAHYLLPGCAHAEKRGTFTNTKGRVQKFMKAVEPPGDARPEREFLRELVATSPARTVPMTIEGLFNQMAQEVPAFTA